MYLDKVSTSSIYNYNGSFSTPSSSTTRVYTYRFKATIPGIGIRSYAASSTFYHKIYLNGTQVINNSSGSNVTRTYSGHINVGDIIDLFVTGNVGSFIPSYFNPSWGGSNSVVGVGIDYEYQTVYIDTTANAPTWCCIKY